MGLEFPSYGRHPRIEAVADGHFLLRVEVEVEEPWCEADVADGGEVDVHVRGLGHNDLHVNLVLLHPTRHEFPAPPEVNGLALRLPVSVLGPYVLRCIGGPRQ